MPNYAVHHKVYSFLESEMSKLVNFLCFFAAFVIFEQVCELQWRRKLSSETEPGIN